MTSIDPRPPPGLERVRADLARLFERESHGPGPRDVVLLALDGIDLTTARQSLRHAVVEPRTAVFPTTSSAGWLSSMTGLSVDRHGVPGVVFTVAGELVNALTHGGEELCARSPNVFSDARTHGYRPLALTGDLVGLPGRWRSCLLAHADVVEGPALVTGPGVGPPALEILREAVDRALTAPPADPRVVWVHVDLDQHVHRHGYDTAVHAFLQALDLFAVHWADTGRAVLAWSDHGLVRTRHDPHLAGTIRALEHRLGVRTGGAGRVRWLYCPPGTEEAVTATLHARLPPAVRLHDRSDLFDPAGPAHDRIGAPVLLPTGERFLAEPGVRYEHGSRLRAETQVFMAGWGTP